MPLGASKDEVIRTLERYPTLVFTIDGDAAAVRGTFPVQHDGMVLDRFAVDIAFPPDYPLSPPIVRETASRIPAIADRHISPDGTACLFVPEEWTIFTDDRSFGAFLGGPVHNFFLGQIVFEEEKRWPFGEHPHGLPGLFAAYGHHLGAADPAAVTRFLDDLTKEKILGHWPCPCGSGKILRSCHVTHVRALQRRVSPAAARGMRDRIARLSGQKAVA
jgi:hypothetical protein